jgi:predicted metal-binding membrane protein
MDAGPGTDLGGLGWFAISWLVMMAAMMLPSLIPAALALARDGQRRVAPFVVAYLVVWAVAGFVAYLIFDAVRSLDLAFLTWHRAGRFLAAGVILAAAAYQLTATKAACLEHCRHPLRPISARRAGASAGLWSGLRHGAWCVGCCAGLMTALFALGVMSLTWMIAIAALIAAERLLPWHPHAVYGVAVVLAVLGIWMAIAPETLPGLTLPGSMGM